MASLFFTAREKNIKHILGIFFLFSSQLLWGNELSRAPINETPLLELGLFLGGASLPDYPAADQSRNRTIPAPLVHYHGDLLRADDEDGTRFRFINVEKFDLDLSFGGSFPTDTGNNQARSGMPNLDWTAEVGPRLVYYFYRNPVVAQVRVGFPVRANFATDFVKWTGVGYVFAPTFQVDKYNFLMDGLDLYFNYSPSFISEGIADYFYQIDPQFQTVERNTFDAKSGFLGTEISLAIKYQLGNKRLIIGAQYSDFSQSANSQSYLHRSNINWSYVVAMSWVLYQSEERRIR